MAHIDFYNPGGGGGSSNVTVSYTLAKNTYGSVPGVTASNTSDVVSIPVTEANYKLRGFTATGTGDGYFVLTIDGDPQVSGRIHNTQKSIIVALPNAQLVETGSAVALKVTNEAGVTCDYEGTILGE